MSTLVAGSIAVGVAVLGILWRLLSVAKTSGVDAQKAKEAQAREADLNRIKAAQRAADAVRDDPDSVFNDPRNRTPRGRP